jgi:hypothetical protein
MDINELLLENPGIKKFLSFLALKIDLQGSDITMSYGEFIPFFNGNKDASEKMLYLENKNIFHLKQIVLKNPMNANEIVCPAQEFYHPNIATTLEMSPAIFGFNINDTFYFSCDKERVEELAGNSKLIKIKHIKISESLHQLICNHGDITISFNEKSSSKNKAFIILSYLWEFKREVMTGVETQKKNEFSIFTTLSDLKGASGCLTDGATYQHIKRLNKLFKDRRLPIKIESERSKFKLIIKKS